MPFFKVINCYMHFEFSFDQVSMFVLLFPKVDIEEVILSAGNGPTITNSLVGPTSMVHTLGMFTVCTGHIFTLSVQDYNALLS